MRITDKILNSISWTYFEFVWLIKKLLPARKYEITNFKYTIGITTYRDRYDIFFKKLIKRISLLFADTEIIVTINGYYDKEKQAVYLQNLEKFIEKYPNVKIIKYVEPQGLSKLWNQIIINSICDRVFILNDDIDFSPSIRKDIERSNFFNEKVAMINNSFSFFILSKEFAKEIGGFDERFIEIGGEDTDFLVRMACLGCSYPSVYEFKYLKNQFHKPKINSYGNKVENEAYKYSTYNHEFLNKKWDIRDDYFEGSILSIYDNYWKLRSGMEAPKYL